MTTQKGLVRGATGCVLLVLAGCQIPSTRIQLTTYDETGKEQHHYADFKRVAFMITPDGLLELAMRSEQPSSLDPTQTITQLVHMKQVWRPQPGRTAVQSTQIDAVVRYAILTPPTGVRYDGSAFVFSMIKKDANTITGQIESGRLGLAYLMGDAAPPFGPARLVGPFRAARNEAEVMEISRQLDLLFSKPARR
jgi:hypothetical protein